MVSGLFWAAVLAGAAQASYVCSSDVQLNPVAASGQKGLAMDDDTLRWCPGQIPQLWPNSEVPLTSIRLFKAWDKQWDEGQRQVAWTNLKDHLVNNGGKILMGVPVTCDEADDEQHWTWAKELLGFLGADRIMGLAIGNELELLKDKDPSMVPPACVESIWEQGRLWTRFQHVVSEFDALGLAHLPVTTVFTGVALVGSPFQEQPGARTNTFLTNATGKYGDRFVFTINFYPFWDPNAWLDAGTTDQCSQSIAWATSFASSGSVPDQLRTTRSRMLQLTGSDSNQLWIGETGWSEPAPDDFAKVQMANCPAWTSKETFQKYYEDFLKWDLSIGDGARAPEHVFYFSMRDSWNFGKREGFGLIAACDKLECKVHSDSYSKVSFEMVAHAPSDEYCEGGFLSEFYPDPVAHGHELCQSRCLMDSTCRYFSYWESNWCRLTSSCQTFAHAPGKAIVTFRKAGHEDQEQSSGGSDSSSPTSPTAPPSSPSAPPPPGSDTSNADPESPTSPTAPPSSPSAPPPGSETADNEAAIQTAEDPVSSTTSTGPTQLLLHAACLLELVWLQRY